MNEQLSIAASEGNVNQVSQSEVASKTPFAASKASLMMGWQVNSLLRQGGDVNAIGSILTPPLHAAIRHSHVEVIQLLLHNNADVLLADKFGVSLSLDAPTSVD